MTMTEVEAPPEKPAERPRTSQPKSVSIDLGVLREAVRIAGRAAAKSSGAIPAWCNLRLEAKAGTLTVTGYDGDLTITHSVKLSGGRSSFVAFVHAGLLTKIVGVCPEPGVGIKVAADTVEISSGELEFVLRRAIGGDEFLVPEPPNHEGYLVPGLELVAALGHVLHGVSADGSRPLLTGVQFGGESGLLAATDSYVLAISEGPVGELPEMIVPGDVLREVANLFGDEEVVTVRASDNLVSFEGDHSRVSVRLIEGDFPPWRALDPKPESLPASFTVDRLAFIAAVRAVSILAWAEEPVRLEVEPDAVRVSLVGVDVGSSGYRLDAAGTSPGFVVALNPAKLIGVLNSLEGNFVTVQGSDMLKPVLIHDGRPAEVRAIQMPVRVS